ncbi:hypothetical protein [Flavisolibacter ginsengisoli]|jgi:hypothetical protein|uniref:Uncharacterized protein n=1 Tax=Flavisolibacter ginsengisoli DSM 18119 TaxID=1121884 RepID=A0A1M4YQJ5_9BACT|nr:hypothetical protein [Flavisolibacter ginsengisoli]SHF08075.1 hypothetical protein SAMN02745131_01726 [Flavisolibacter ginsengisoli DSM 18119]
MKNTTTQDQEKRYVKIRAQKEETAIPASNKNTNEEAAHYAMHPLQYWASPNFFLAPLRKK